jgi:hypothetical protein
MLIRNCRVYLFIMCISIYDPIKINYFIHRRLGKKLVKQQIFGDIQAF